MPLGDKHGKPVNDMEMFHLRQMWKQWTVVMALPHYCRLPKHAATAVCQDCSPADFRNPFLKKHISDVKFQCLPLKLGRRASPSDGKWKEGSAAHVPKKRKESSSIIGFAPPLVEYSKATLGWHVLAPLFLLIAYAFCNSLVVGGTYNV